MFRIPHHFLLGSELVSEQRRISRREAWGRWNRQKMLSLLLFFQEWVLNIVVTSSVSRTLKRGCNDRWVTKIEVLESNPMLRAAGGRWTVDGGHNITFKKDADRWNIQEVYFYVMCYSFCSTHDEGITATRDALSINYLEIRLLRKRNHGTCN